MAGRRWRRLRLTPTLVAGRRLRVTYTRVARRRWQHLRLIATLVAGRRWRYLRLNLYPCGGMALAAFETYTYSCDGTALTHLRITDTLVAGRHWRRLTLIPILMTRRRWWHLRSTLYPCGGTALAAFLATTKIPLSEGPAALTCQGPFGPPLAPH